MTFLIPVFLLLALPCAALMMFRRPPTTGMTWLRTLVLLLLVLALARPVARLPRRGGTVIVLADRSASITPQDLAAQERLIAALATRRPSDGKIGVISFAEKAYLEHPPQTAPFKSFSAIHNPDASDLAGAMRLAGTLALQSRGATRAFVLSDGRVSGEIPLTAKFPVDYRLQSRRSSDDLAILRVEAPQSLRPGEALLATAFVSSPDERDITYTLRRGATPVAHGTRRVPRGASHLVFRDIPPADDTISAVAGYELRIESAPESSSDPVPENNTARFLVQIREEKPLLLISPNPATSPYKNHAISQFPNFQISQFDLATLSGYSGIILENVRADAFGDSNLANIAEWVRHTGAGLLMTGGANSFGMGGYYKSPLEDILPVSMELRREHRKFSMAVAIVMDISGSMGMTVGGGRTKIDMANIGCLEVLGLLSPQDEISVIAVNTEAHVIFPMMSAASAQAERGHIMGIVSRGAGIYIHEALVAALKELKKSNAGVRHILLFSDAADSVQNPGDYRNLVAGATAAGVTVSVVGLGNNNDCDAWILREIGENGGGTLAFSDNAAELPRLFAQDTIAMARNTLVTNAVAPLFTRALPLLSDTLPPTAPDLGGYNLCYIVPDATAVAISDDENAAPLVAFRPAGAGRAIVFTGETDGKHSGDFARWEHAAEFHSALARWSAGPKNNTLPGYHVRQRLVPGGVGISAFVESPQLLTVNSSLLTCSILRHRTGDTPRAGNVKLEWTTPDTLSAVIPLSGSETFLATLSDENNNHLTLPPVCLPYSSEFAPDDGRGAELLASLAIATGGKQIADPAAVWDFMPKEPRSFELSPILYLLASLVYLAEILERRTGMVVTFLRNVRMKIKNKKLKTKNSGGDVSGEGLAEKGKRPGVKRKPVDNTQTDKDDPPPPPPPPSSSVYSAAKSRASSETKR